MFDRFYYRVIKFIDSRLFFGLVLTLFTAQALWIALSFRYPMLYDEVFHYNVTKIFSHQLTPFITNQPTAYDQFGSLAHGNSAIYHYLLSIPYRVIAVLTSSLAIQVILLRIINIAMALAGLWFFAILLRQVGFKQKYVNVSLLVFSLLPMTPLVAATINYDNMLFPLLALYLLLSVRIIRANKISWFDLLALIAVGSLASLVKFSFLPVFVATGLFLTIYLWRKFKARFYSDLMISVKGAKRWQLALSAFVTLALVGMVAGVYGLSVIRYKNPTPVCDQILSVQRCESYNIYSRNANAIKTRAQRPAEQLPQYTYKVWFDFMMQLTNWSGNTVNNIQVTRQGLPIMNLLLFFGSLIGFVIFFYQLKDMTRNDVPRSYLIFVAFILIGSLYLFNAKSYYDLHTPYGDQPRYLLGVIPILIAFIVLATASMFQKSAKSKLATLVLVLVLFVQGGGVITHILRSDDSWYWQNEIVIKANHAAKDVLHPLVKE